MSFAWHFGTWRIASYSQRQPLSTEEALRLCDFTSSSLSFISPRIGQISLPQATMQTGGIKPGMSPVTCTHQRPALRRGDPHCAVETQPHTLGHLPGGSKLAFLKDRCEQLPGDWLELALSSVTKEHHPLIFSTLPPPTLSIMTPWKTKPWNQPRINNGQQWIPCLQRLPCSNDPRVVDLHLLDQHGGHSWGTLF